MDVPSPFIKENRPMFIDYKWLKETTATISSLYSQEDTHEIRVPPIASAVEGKLKLLQKLLLVLKKILMQR
jgi:hypothetical protein